MENLYASSGQGADGGTFRSDLQDMGRQSAAPAFVDFFQSPAPAAPLFTFTLIVSYEKAPFL